jgi:hypothetical protein
MGEIAAILHGVPRATFDLDILIDPMERTGELGERFGCVIPEEAAASHELFDAALQSGLAKQVVSVTREFIANGTI